MTEPLYLQYAACGRPSAATVRAMTDHLEAESRLGGYVAEDAAAAEVARLYDDLGARLGVPADHVALTDSAAGSLLALLGAWPLPENAEVAVTPSEWGPNLELFAHRGLRTRLLPSDADGVLDLDGLERTLTADPPGLVHLVHLASHRGLVQPVAEAAALCREHGVPLWVDAAQSFAHLDTAFGADAVYAPLRKWLSGPRGVGVLGVRDPDRLEPFVRSDHAAPVVRALEPDDAPVAAHVGAATAVREAGPERSAALAETGERLRTALADLPGWAVADAATARGALVGLRPTDDRDVVHEQRRLAEDHGILTTACLPWRAPNEMTEPLLRLAAPADLEDEQIDRLAGVLAG